MHKREVDATKVLSRVPFGLWAPTRKAEPGTTEVGSGVIIVKIVFKSCLCYG